MSNAATWTKFASDPTCVSDQILALLRRDWALQVLDAWIKRWRFHYTTYGDAIYLHHTAPPREYANRMAAAQAVWLDLPEAVRAEIQECP